VITNGVVAPLGAVSNNGASIHNWIDTVEEYLSWGRAFGGKKGRPWSPAHARMVKDSLCEWSNYLQVDNIGQLGRASVEKHLASMQSEYAPATICRRFEVIRGFVTWCLGRDYYAFDPLKGLRKPNADPQTQRRALTQDEFCRIMVAAPPYRRLLYDTAIDTGLRADELRQLEVGDLDTNRQGIRLNAAIDKARKERFVLLSPDLCKRLAQAAKGKDAKAPLLKITRNAVREFDKDCRRANPKVEKLTPEGKIDFHALRTAAITWFEESGAPDAHVREFGRHATSTASARYRRTKEDDMRLLKAKSRNGLQEKLAEIHSMPWMSPSSSPAQDIRFSALPPTHPNSDSSDVSLISDCALLVYKYVNAPANVQQHIHAILDAMAKAGKP
jgi:integrase